MYKKFLELIQRASDWQLIGGTLFVVEVLVAVLGAAMEVILLGKVTYDYLLTGVVVSFVAAFLVTFVLASVIGQLKKTDALLRESQDRLAEAQRLAHIGSWEWDVVADSMVWSRELYRMYGSFPVEGRARYQDFLAYIHPQERERIDRALRSALHDKKPCEMSYRILRQDKTERILHMRAEVCTGSGGKAAYIIGTVQDVTEQKAMEQALTSRSRELERMNQFMVGRELKMIALKRELDELKKKHVEGYPFYFL